MRVLALNPSGLVGGAELSLMDVLEGLIARRHSVLLAMPERGSLLAAAAARGIPVCEWRLGEALLKAGRYSGALSLARSALASGYAVWSLARLARAARPDVIYSNGVKSHLLSAAVAPFLRVPNVWHVRDFVAARRFAPFLFAAARHTTRLVIANSSAVAREWEQHGIPVEVAHNGFGISNSATAPRHHSGAPLRFLATGILAPWKGFDLVLRACAALPANLDWRLTICGDELYETDGHRGVRIRLEDIAKELRIADRVAFAGMVKDLGPYWRDADVFLHGSVKPEPFGRVVAEAMLAELPVIAPNAGGIPEFVRDGIDGLLYPMGDFRALRDAIVSVASGAEGRNAMGAAARQRIERDFPIEATVERVERSLADVIAGRNLHRSRICVKSA